MSISPVECMHALSGDNSLYVSHICTHLMSRGLTFVHTLWAEALTALFSVSFQGCLYNGQPQKIHFLFSPLEERADLFIALKCSVILRSNVEECLFYSEINIISFSGQRQASFLLLKKWISQSQDSSPVMQSTLHADTYLGLTALSSCSLGAENWLHYDYGQASCSTLTNMFFFYDHGIAWLLRASMKL